MTFKLTLLVSLEFDAADVRDWRDAIAEVACRLPKDLVMSPGEVDAVDHLFRRRLPISGASPFAVFSLNVWCEAHQVDRLKWLIEVIGRHARDARYPHGLRCVDGFGGVNPEMETHLRQSYLQQVNATVVDFHV